MVRIVGFGAERIELPATAAPEEIAERRMVMFARCLNMKTTVAVVGAGCSRALGYPDWNELAGGVIAAVLAAIGSCSNVKYQSAAARLIRLSTRTSRTTDELFVTLGFCQQISRDLAKEGYGNPYADFIERTFGSPHHAEPPRDPQLNPYMALLRLPIRRFITSNYDVELERTIAHDDPSLRARYGLEKGAPKEEWLSFTQTDAYVDQQTGFAFSLRDMPHTIFHCHGRYDEPDSMVVTEDDYQRWYLRDDVAGQAFRQNLELLFGSNPIFFVGFSMRDDDLLHAIRLLHASDSSPQRPRARSLFALLPASGDEVADRNRDDLLQKRYHVHVLTYDAPAPEEQGPALCRKLLDLRDRSLEIREDFIRKPVIRKVTVGVNPPQPYLHYAIARDGDDDLDPDRTQQDLERLRDLVSKSAVIVIHGYGGRGKSWRAMDLIDEIRANRGLYGIDGIFFWSSYYADDWLTGVDRMLAYFKSQPAPRLTRVMRMAECLKGRHLIVFDGFERLLRDHGARPEIASAAHAVVEILDAMRGGNSIVVLTMRVMPQMLKGKPGVAEFAMRRAATAELAKGRVFGPLVRPGLLTYDDLAAVCSLCDGHSYALALAAAYLRAAGDAGVQERMQKFRRKLSNASPAHRLTTMIQLAMNDVTARVGAQAHSLLKRIAIFMSPVTPAMVEVCAEGVPCERDMRALLDARLLFNVSADPESFDAPSGYTVHPMVRNYIFHPGSADDLESVPNFTLSGFTSGSTPVHPGSRQCGEAIGELFDSMLGEAEHAIGLGDMDRARQLCRGAFSAIRSRMEANSVTRWTTYDEYLDRFEIPLANLVKRVAPAMWNYMDRSHAPSKEDKDGPLFADELAWLWNDIGLAFFEQGAMVDTHAVRELSYEIDRVTDSYEDGGQYLVQSRLQMTAVFMEMGRLDTASEYLGDTEESNRSYGDDEYAGRILGYKALITHLRGNSEEADRLYEEADAQLQKIGRNLRGRSIFSQHHADLKIAIGELAAAEKLIRTSMALAEEGRHKDLIAYARGSRGHLHRMRKKYREAQLDYDAALAAARAMGMRRLEGDVLCELGRLALSLGDWQTARVRAVAALMIANESWLGLLRSTGLVILGNAMIEANDPRLGAAYLRHAYAMSTKQGYLLRADEAETKLRSVGATFDEMEVEG